MIPGESLRAWQEHTTGGFEAHLMEGDHFFIHQRHEEVVRIVRDRLTNARV
jgi:surfactin synthase thioesterase subunit